MAICYLWPSVEVSRCVHEIYVMFLMCGIAQFALVFTVVVCKGQEVDTDTVGFVVAKQFTDVYAWDLESFYVMLHQTFASEEVKRWKLHLTTLSCCKKLSYSKKLQWNLSRACFLQLTVSLKHILRLMANHFCFAPSPWAGHNVITTLNI